MQKISGVLQVMNTAESLSPTGKTVAGLEAGSCVMSKEATDAAQAIYPSSIIAVTNAHVVGNQTHVMLNFHFSQLPFPAQVIKVNVNNDIAFLHIRPDSPEYKLALGRNEPPTLIEASPIYNPTSEQRVVECAAVGFPLGTSHQTISKGNITAMEVMEDNVIWYHDATINPGNSGGALLDKDGKLLGINTAIMNPGTSISIAKPWSTVNSLLIYLEPDMSIKGWTHDEHSSLLSILDSPLSPETISSAWSNSHGCEHTSCGRSCGHDSFNQWFKKHCYKKAGAHCLLKHVTTQIENTGRVELPEEGWAHLMCNTGCSGGGKGRGGRRGRLSRGVDKIMFESFFKVSTTVPILDRIQEHFPAVKHDSVGVVISKVNFREQAIGLERGNLLVSINNRLVDNYGNFKDNNMPYFTAFKDFPGKFHTLNIAKRGESEMCDVKYNYDRINPKFLPRIHDPSLYTNRKILQIGGLTITQMDSAMAKEYPEYLTEEKHNDVVGVVVGVKPNCAEWVIQRIAPGYLLTEVNYNKMKGSITESLVGAHTLTFVGKNGQKIDKLII